MANVDDVHNMARQVERELEDLAEADIDDRDRAAIREFHEYRAHTQNRAMSTLRDGLGNLRRCAERAEKPLLDFESVKDATRLWSLNKSKYGVSKDTTNQNYADILRQFLRWLHEDPDYGAYPFYESVEVKADPTDPIDEDEILSEDEVRKMREAAGNPMFAAMIELWADTGGRLSAVLQLRRKHALNLEPGRGTRIKFSRSGKNQKGMHTEPISLIDSPRWVRTWLNNYHPDDHPDAPMFVKDSYDPEDRENGALDPSEARRRMKGIAERAGIDPDRVKIHGFRHVATTRMKRIGLDWDQVAHRTGWSDHSIAEMKRIYNHLTAEELNESIDDKVHGPQPDAEDDDDLGTLDCGNCPATGLPPDTEYCPDCGFPVGDEAKREALGEGTSVVDTKGFPPEAVEAMLDEALAVMKRTDDEETMNSMAKLRDRLYDGPDDDPDDDAE